MQLGYSALYRIVLFEALPLLYSSLAALSRDFLSALTSKVCHALDSLEEVNISKLLYLLHVDNLDDLLVIEEHPRKLIANLLADECDVMPE